MVRSLSGTWGWHRTAEGNDLSSGSLFDFHAYDQFTKFY